MNDIVDQATVNHPNTRISQCVLTVLQSVNPGIAIEHELDPSASLVEYGFTSLAMVSLIMALESKMDIQFEDSDLTFENFNSIDAISRMLSTKLGVKAVLL